MNSNGWFFCHKKPEGRVQINKKLIQDTVIHTMSFYEDEIIEMVWEEVKDQAGLPITDMAATVQQLADLTKGAMREVLELSS